MADYLHKLHMGAGVQVYSNVVLVPIPKRKENYASGTDY